jgi:uncharacterized protein (TIGR02145 family)
MGMKHKHAFLIFLILGSLLTTVSSGQIKSTVNQGNAPGSNQPATGVFKDSRDGKVYKTVIIGTQTWMAENLGWKAPDEYRAFDDDEANAPKYGYLYTWAVAKNACPAGWHLPSLDETKILADFLGGVNEAGNKLKSTTLWESPSSPATNSSGFNSLPAGYYRHDGSFNNFGTMSTFWVSSACDEEKAYYMLMTNEESGFYKTCGPRTYYFYVRCLKN